MASQRRPGDDIEIGVGKRLFRTSRLRQDWNAGDDLASLPQPWRLTPQSTRVSKFRWDGGNQQVHVVFKRTGIGYVYRDVPYAVYRNMVRVKSKGRFVGRVLEDYDYGVAGGDWG